MKDPLLVNDVLSPEDYKVLTNAVSNPKSFEYQKGFSKQERQHGESLVDDGIHARSSFVFS